MISTIYYLQERAALNVAIAVASGMLWLVLSVYLLMQVHVSRTWGSWYSDRLGNQAAVAVWFLALGKTVKDGWAAFLSVMFLHGQDIAPVENKFPIAFVGACCLYAGILCVVRIFTPGRWGERLWLFTGALGIFAAYYFVYL